MRGRQQITDWTPEFMQVERAFDASMSVYRPVIAEGRSAEYLESFGDCLSDRMAEDGCELIDKVALDGMRLALTPVLGISDIASATGLRTAQAVKQRLQHEFVASNSTAVETLRDVRPLFGKVYGNGRIKAVLAMPNPDLLGEQDLIENVLAIGPPPSGRERVPYIPLATFEGGTTETKTKVQRLLGIVAKELTFDLEPVEFSVGS